jgi:putative glycosyltransferase (TIGR04372 family)
MLGLVGKVRAKVNEKGLRHCVRAALQRLARPLRRASFLARHHARVAYYQARGRLIISYWETRGRLLMGLLHARLFFRAALARALGLGLWAAGVRLLPVMTQCFGHLALEVDCFLKEGALGKRPRYTGLLIVPPGTPVANECLLDYWGRLVWVVRSPFLSRLLAPCFGRGRLCYRTDQYVIAMNRTARSPALQAEWGSRPPLLRLTAGHRERGRACLRELGVPDGAPFVCVHCREPGYRPGEQTSDCRDADITTYLPAVAALVARGYWCVRLGDPSMRPLPPRPGLIDYAHSPLRGDWMDLFLLADCRFVLGSSSGPCQVATALGVPSASANHVPLSVVYSHGPHDVSIPKLFWSRAGGRYLTFAELLGGPLGNARFTGLYEEAGVDFIENTPEDIRDLAVEMADRVEGAARYSDDDERRQRGARALFRPGHYSYGAGGRLGRDFLRKYEALIRCGAALLAA